VGDRHTRAVPGLAGISAGDAHGGDRRHGDGGRGKDRRCQTTEVILIELRLGLWIGVHGGVHAGLIPGWNLVVGQGVLVLVGLGHCRGVGCRHVWLVGSRGGIPGRPQLLPGWLGLWLFGKLGFLGSRLVLRLLAWRHRTKK